MEKVLSSKFLVVIVILFLVIGGALVLFYRSSQSSQSPGGQKSGGSSTPNATYNPVIDPNNFVAEITNKYFPLKPGKVFTYEGNNGTVKSTTTVTNEHKTILGVQTTTVKDTLLLNGQLHEDTLDWYAQDKEGNVWYFGEDTKEYQNGKVVSTEGTWEAGVNGAKPGIIMQANPQIGGPIYQEYYQNHAEDQFQVLSTNESLTLPIGKYEGCIKTKEWTRLEPSVAEEKVFCPGIGFAQATTVKGGSDFSKLTSIKEP
jgi:hypothetical protein